MAVMFGLMWTICHMQVHLSRNNVPMVKPPLNHTSLPSMMAIFLTTCLMVVVKIVDGGLYFIFIFIFIFSFFPFSIFRTAWVRVDWSRCHISHKLMAKSQDWSRDLGELNRRFKNKWCHTTWTPHVNLMDYTWLFRVGCTVASTDHL